jgi:hypothetical protein
VLPQPAWSLPGLNGGAAPIPRNRFASDCTSESPKRPGPASPHQASNVLPAPVSTLSVIIQRPPVVTWRCPRPENAFLATDDAESAASTWARAPRDGGDLVPGRGLMLVSCQ